jgi:hypothetical protein
MIEVAPCPVCCELDDCEHRLVEWYGWPGERIRGSLCPLIKRMESSIARVMVLCAQADEPPRHPELTEAFHAALDAVNTDGLNEETVLSESHGPVAAFIGDCIRTAPGVTEVVSQELQQRGWKSSGVVSLFAADRQAVRQHLLDLLAAIEVQGDQLYFERVGKPGQ